MHPTISSSELSTFAVLTAAHVTPHVWQVHRHLSDLPYMAQFLKSTTVGPKKGWGTFDKIFIETIRLLWIDMLTQKK
jgi:hypothetical protein